MNAHGAGDRVASVDNPATLGTVVAVHRVDGTVSVQWDGHKGSERSAAAALRAYPVSVEYAYERGVMLDGTTATYPLDGVRCATCGQPGDYAVRVPLIPLRSPEAAIQAAVPEQVLLPCGHLVERPNA